MRPTVHRPARRTAAAVVATAPLALASLVAGPVTAQAAVTPGVNGGIVFTYPNGPTTGISRYSANGSLFDLTTGSPWSAPAASPDGQRVAAVDPSGEVVVMDVDGTHQQVVTPTGSRAPAWSADGTTIAYARLNQVWLVPADGGHARMLTDDGGGADEPSFSPDGRSLVYQRYDSALTSYQIARIDLDGTNQVQLSHMDTLNLTHPAYSPDGTAILVAGSVSFGQADIFAMSADGTSLTNLTLNASDDENPAWSPDGTLIAFDSDRLGASNRQIWTMTANGTGAFVRYNGVEPSWVSAYNGCLGRAATITGTPAADVITGTPGPDVIAGGAGNDVIDGGGGADVICGGAGIDTVTYAGHQGGVTADLSGSAGDDGSSEDGPVGARDSIAADVERLTGGHGDDVLVGNNLANVLVGGAGDDVLKGQEGNDQLTGGTGQDSLSGGDGNDTLSGGSSDDMLAGGEGNDTVDGGADGDTLAGGPGVDTDTYASRTAPLVVSIGAGTGDDGEKLDGPVGERDTVRASVENLVGGASSDSLTGNDLDNTLTGGLGKDTLKGLAGVDTLIANDGVADTLIDCGGDTDNPAQVDGLDPAPVSCP